MSNFRAIVTYESPSHEETVEIRASTALEAEGECLRIIEDSRSEAARLESMNVYSSRRVVGCRLERRPWREELLSIELSVREV